MAIVLCLLRANYLRVGRICHYEIIGRSLLIQRVQLVLLGIVAAIPILQLQARMAQSTYALAQNGIAPYEVAGEQFRKPVLPFSPKYRLGHPGNYLFSLSNKYSFWIKQSKKAIFKKIDSENRRTAGNPSIDGFPSSAWRC